MELDDYDLAGHGTSRVDDEAEDEDISPDLWQEACWIVISAYFDEKGRPACFCGYNYSDHVYGLLYLTSWTICPKVLSI